MKKAAKHKKGISLKNKLRFIIIAAMCAILVSAIICSIIYSAGLYILWYTICAVTIVVIFIVILDKILYRDFFMPLKEMDEKMRDIAKGKYGATAEVATNSEIGQIADSFNAMSKELKNYIEHKFKEEILIKDAQIQSMQAAINPHFLYNTLDLIHWKARMCGNIEVADMIVNLAKLLDGALDKSTDRIISFAEELDYLKYYFNILSFRYKDKIAIHTDISPETLEMSVPKITMQPIIENAVSHGVEPGSGGNIWIKSYLDNFGGFFIEIENDGKKITEEKCKELQELLKSTNINQESDGGIGFLNVHNRIRLICGEGYGLSILGTRRGTKVVIKLCQNIVFK